MRTRASHTLTWKLVPLTITWSGGAPPHREGTKIPPATAFAGPGSRTRFAFPHRVRSSSTASPARRPARNASAQIPLSVIASRQSPKGLGGTPYRIVSPAPPLLLQLPRRDRVDVHDEVVEASGAGQPRPVGGIEDVPRFPQQPPGVLRREELEEPFRADPRPPREKAMKMVLAKPRVPRHFLEAGLPAEIPFDIMNRLFDPGVIRRMHARPPILIRAPGVRDGTGREVPQPDSCRAPFLPSIDLSRQFMYTNGPTEIPAEGGSVDTDGSLTQQLKT